MTEGIKNLIAGHFDDGFVCHFLIFNWLTGVVLIAILSFFTSEQIIVGTAIGFAIASLNSAGLHKDCLRVMRYSSVYVYYGGLAVRIGLIALVVTVALLYLKSYVSPIGLFIGLSVPVINFYLLTLLVVITTFRYKYKEAC